MSFTHPQAIKWLAPRYGEMIVLILRHMCDSQLEGDDLVELTSFVLGLVVTELELRQRLDDLDTMLEDELMSLIREIAELVGIGKWRERL